jgi:hypothetical protein
MASGLQSCIITQEKDWTISKVPVDDAIARWIQESQSGDRKRSLDMLYGMYFKPGAGGKLPAQE